ncbi:reverse transcriptase domain-containing protein [Tanacetum coccineum]|uniref:Reverse transcriptase domain-containing protein n=1 Tax=Tanacetum coccineum TaxID=301880 RepID=A0ABQ5B3E4_9ASTR
MMTLKVIWTCLTLIETELIGFSGENLIPIRKVELELTFGSDGLCPRTMMKFTVTALVYECRWSEKKKPEQEEKREKVEPGELEGSEEEQVLVKPAYLEQKVTIGIRFAPACQLQLINLLKDNKDVFAWQPSDMQGVPRRIIQHSLNNVNLACPKDYHLLPEIDLKIKEVMGFPFKCFLDTYKGYNRIQMLEEDEEKTAFYTNQGIYCYTKMPFGLKNTGATYQRLMDLAFKAQLGWNLESYVDDMVIKSKT